MRLLLDHDSDRGECADKLGAFVSNLAMIAFVVGAVAWFLRIPIP